MSPDKFVPGLVVVGLAVVCGLRVVAWNNVGIEVDGVGGLGQV